MIGLLMLCMLPASELPLMARAQKCMDKKELKATETRTETGDVGATASMAYLEICYNRPELYQDLMAERSGRASQQPTRTTVTAVQQSAPQQQLTPEQEAAANNNATYCYNRGTYFCNQASPRDYRAAVAWLKRAYELGNRDACYDLGLCYSLSDSPLLDHETAHMWFGLGLANTGDTNYWRCCYQLGFDFKAGRGVERNYDSAIYFFEQALKYNPVPGNVSTIRNLISQCRQEMNASSGQGTAVASSGNDSGGNNSHNPQQSSSASRGNGTLQGGFDYVYKASGDQMGMRVVGIPHDPVPYVAMSYEISIYNSMSTVPMTLWGDLKQVDEGYKLEYVLGTPPIYVMARYTCILSPDLETATFSMWPGKVYRRTDESPEEFMKKAANMARLIEENGGGAGGSVSAPSGQVQSGMSASYYQETYDRWARVAESAYRSLTATGISVHNRKTDEHAGSSAGTWQGSNYAGMKSELRRAQNAMRDVRNEAQRNGITIRQSTWETATVSY